MVTHNANLVVNTDAEQIIIDNAGAHTAAGLPPITYRSSGLDEAPIRKTVCDILKGGGQAFRDRVRRIRVIFKLLSQCRSSYLAGSLVCLNVDCCCLGRTRDRIKSTSDLDRCSQVVDATLYLKRPDGVFCDGSDSSSRFNCSTEY